MGERCVVRGGRRSEVSTESTDPGTIAGLITLAAGGIMALWRVWSEARKQDAQRDADFREDYVEDARSARDLMRQVGVLEGRIERLEGQLATETERADREAARAERERERGDEYKEAAARRGALLEHAQVELERAGMADVSDPISEELEAADEALSMEVGDGG